MVTKQNVHLLLLEGFVSSLELSDLRNTNPGTETQLGSQLSSTRLHRTREMLSEMYGRVSDVTQVGSQSSGLWEQTEITGLMLGALLGSC